MSSLFSFAHIGIHATNTQDAINTAELLGTLFGLPVKITAGKSPFVGSKIEIVPGGALGTKGHLAFYVTDMDAGIAVLEKQGFTMNMSTAKYDEDGSLYLVYLEQMICGFAIHLKSRN